VVVFVGSSDCTVEEVRKFIEAGLRLIEITEYKGKNFVLNIALKNIDCDVMVFSDANSELQSKALCYLVRQQTGETGRARVHDLACNRPLVPSRCGRSTAQL